MFLLNWKIIHSTYGDYAIGNVYGHAGFLDGTCIHTTAIESIETTKTEKIINTRNSIYRLPLDSRARGFRRYDS